MHTEQAAALLCRLADTFFFSVALVLLCHFKQERGRLSLAPREPLAPVAATVTATTGTTTVTTATTATTATG